MKKIMIINIFIFLLTSSVCFSGSNVTIDELLSRYNQALDNMQSKYVQGETIRVDEDSWAKKPKYYIHETKSYTDGIRVDINMGDWIPISGKDDRYFDDLGYSTRFIWDGNSWYEHNKPVNIENQSVFVSDREIKKDELLFSNDSIAIDGYYLGNSKTVSSIFHECDKITQYDKMENVNGVMCYVLEADTEYGKHTIWLDSEHGYNVCQAKIIRTKDDIYYDKPLSETKNYDKLLEQVKLPDGEPPLPTGQKKEVIFTMNNVKFQEYGGIWTPISGDWEEKIIYENDRVLKKSFYYKRIKLDLSPDFVAANAFKTNIPNGTMVRLENENIIIPYHWMENIVEPDVDEVLVDAIDETMEDFAREVLSNDIQFPEVEQDLNNQDIKKDGNDIKRDVVINSTNGNEKRNILGSVTVIILIPIIGIISILYVFRIKKRNDI